jgi:anaerobic magnesium-protoporphyrin IX monomethyl ester cyclase
MKHPDKPTTVLCTLPIVKPGDQYRYMDKQKAFRSPRLGIQVIRDYLVREGNPKEYVKFFDIEMLAPSDDEIRDYLRSTRPNIVGLSAVLSHSYQQVQRIASIIRGELPDAWIVVGGNLSASANVVLRKTDVDLCVVGDGEEVFSNFVEYVKEWGSEKNYGMLKQIHGLCFLAENDEIYFENYAKRPTNETIPMPDYEFFKSGLLDKPDLIDRYFLPVTHMGTWFCLDPRTHEPHRRQFIAQFYTSKGCTARCTFCQRNTRGYRLANLEDIEAHLMVLIEKYNVGFISCMDENFGSRPDHARAFADLMHKYDLLWTATGVRCVNVTREDIEYFKSKGCCSLKFGVESGSQAILDSMEKNFTVSDVEKALTACWENGLFSPMAVMVGMPGEDRQTIAETGEFLGTMAYKLGVHPDYFDSAIFYALPFPGTPLYDHCTQVGLIGENVDAEEAYLKKMANGLTDKWHYLNVNGARTIDIVSWDYLIQWEAVKTFQTLQKNNPRKKTELARAWEEHVKKSMTPREKMKRRRNRRISLFAILVVVGKTYRTPIVRKLPRSIAYPFIRISFYMTTLIYHWVGRMIGRPTFKMYKERNRPPRFVRPDVKEKRLDRSLRAVVNANRSAVGVTAITREKLLRGAAN